MTKLSPEQLKKRHQQKMMDELNTDYEQYKKDHPDFKRVVEEEEEKRLGNDGSIFGQKFDWKFNHNHYQYRELDKDNYEIKVQFSISRDRLEIIEEICDLKEHGIIPWYVSKALFNQVENDLRQPETIAASFCEHKLKQWIGYQARHQPSIKDEIDR